MKSFFALFLFFGSIALADGGVVGNGGDIVTCQASTENDFDGQYVLDYLATYDGTTEYIESENPIETIYQSLWDKRDDVNFGSNYQEMADSLYFFFLNAKEQLFKKPMYQNYFIWIHQPYGLIDLKDEDLVQRLPENCLTKNGRDVSINLLQAIVREGRPSATFRYDAKAMQQLAKQSRLQMSFLLVHEWLRAIYPSTRTLRDVNRLLHSQEFVDAPASLATKMFGRVSGTTPSAPPIEYGFRYQKPPDFTWPW